MTSRCSLAAKVVLLTYLIFPILTQAKDLFIGKIIRIVDGDTLVLLDENNQQIRIRLAGIDAPEKRQPFGKRAKQALGRLAAGKIALANCPKMDRYGRYVCKVTVDTTDAGLSLIQQGLAWHYKKYAHEQSPEDRQSYADSEDRARSDSTGLWIDPSAIPPWQWRHH